MSSATSRDDGHPRAGQTADHRALHRPRRGPPAAAFHQEGGEGPSHGARGATQVTARSWTRGDLPRASLTTPTSIVNQTRHPLDTPASLGNQPGAQHVGGSGNEALED